MIYQITFTDGEVQQKRLTRSMVKELARQPFIKDIECVSHPYHKINEDLYEIINDN